MTHRAVHTMAGIAAVIAVATACSSSGRPSKNTSAATPAHVSASPSSTTTALPSGVLASIPLTCCGRLINGAPEFPTSSFGSLWVVSHRGTHVFRIDPRTDKVIAAIDVNDESCTPPVASPHYLIVERCNTTSGAKIDPRTNQVIGSVPGHIGAYAFGSAWGVTGDFAALERVDLNTNRVTVVRRMNVGPIAVTQTELWTLEENDSGYVAAGIMRIDPRTNRVLGTVHIPNPGYDPYIINAYGAMWIKGGDNPVLVRVDTHTRKVTSYALSGYAAPTDLGAGSPAAGEGSVWVRLNADWIARIEPHTGKIIGRYPSDGNDTGAAVQVAFGSLWVTSADGGLLLRDRIDKP